MKRNQLAAAGFAALLFGGGAAVGALGHRFYNAEIVKAGPNSEAGRHRYVAEMENRLKLTPSQVKQLEGILDDTKAKYHAVRDSYKPQMLKIKLDHIERVKSILTAQQIPAYEKLVAEREQRSRDQEEHDRKSEHHATH